MQKLDERMLSAIDQQDWLDSAASSVQDFVRNLFEAGGSFGRSTKDFLHGTWLAHPLHSVTNDVTIGAWTTAQAFDIAEMAGGRRPSGAATGAVAIGLAGAAASAASGLADWSETSGSQKRLGLVHATLNATAVVLYSASLISRIASNHSLGRLLSGLGFSTVLVSAYIGGDLAYRLGTQVDRNAWAKTIGGFAPVMKEAELRPDTPTRVETKGIRIMLVKRGDHLYALNDVCSHAGCSLSKGRLERNTIVCNCHGSTYRLEDGSVVHGPTVYPQPTFDVRVSEDRIEVKSRAG